jgi:hypothetical protein
MQYDPIAITALAKCVNEDDAKGAIAEVPEGLTADLSFLVRVSGMLKRGRSCEVKPTANLLSKSFIGELLRRMGVTREAAKKHLRAIAQEALAAGGRVGDGLVNANPELLLAVKEVEDELIAKLPKAKRAGAIRAILTTDLSDIQIHRQAA